ncbi:hypothetical protein L2W11_10320 [Sediminivirga luteola]|nr:hypothetical protein [Sediminivirga luteola]
MGDRVRLARGERQHLAMCESGGVLAGGPGGRGEQFPDPLPLFLSAPAQYAQPGRGRMIRACGILVGGGSLALRGCVGGCARPSTGKRLGPLRRHGTGTRQQGRGGTSPGGWSLGADVPQVAWNAIDVRAFLDLRVAGEQLRQRDDEDEPEGQRDHNARIHVSTLEASRSGSRDLIGVSA